MNLSTREKIALFRRCFDGRLDAYGTRDPRNGRAWQVKEPVTDAVMLAHLRGEQPYGVYLLVEDRTRAVVADFDHDDLEPPMAFQVGARHYGLATYIERSKSKGYHVWMFFEEGGVPAVKARLVVRHILDEIKYPLTEIFPKQDRVDARTAFGNYIYAPLFGTLVPHGRTVFLNPQGGFKPCANQWQVLAGVERVTERQLDEIIEINELTLVGSSAPVLRVDAAAAGRATSFGLPLCARRMLAEGVTQNQRVSCFRLAVHLKNAGVPQDAAVGTLLTWATKNRPADGKRIITADEIESQVAAAYERGYRSCGCEDAAVNAFCSPACPVRLAHHGSPARLPVEKELGYSIARGRAAHILRRDRHEPLLESQLEEQAMSEQSPRRPIKEYRAGPVKIAIWQNYSEQNGQRVIRHSVRIGKRYFDRLRNAWLDSDYFFVNDLPRLRLLVEKAFEFIALNKSDPDAAEASNDPTADANIEA